MTLSQGIRLAALAKAQGLALEAESGKVRIVTVTYRTDGGSDVAPHTDWVDFSGALEFLTRA